MVGGRQNPPCISVQYLWMETGNLGIQLPLVLLRANENIQKNTAVQLLN